MSEVQATGVDTATFKIANERIGALLANIKSVIVIQPDKLDYIIAAKLAGGHVILADSHGVGKTSLARALSGSINWAGDDRTNEGVLMDHFSRIQCTVDLLPQDILGFTRFDMGSGKQDFTRGPIFAHFVLCDEINLLTPKTQGSFLQAMEESTVTIEGKTYSLPEPFFIIATMNLKGSHLFPLPAPQLDRFMIQISLGYPSLEDEKNIVTRHGAQDSWAGFKPVVDAQELVAWRRLVDFVTIKPEVIDYLVRLCRQTRNFPGIITGASPRTGIKLSRMARALALVRGQDFVSIDVIKELMYPVIAHRLELEDPSHSPEEILNRVAKDVRV